MWVLGMYVCSHKGRGGIQTNTIKKKQKKKTKKKHTHTQTNLVVVGQQLEAREAKGALPVHGGEELLGVLVLALEPHGPEEVVQDRLRPVRGRLEEELCGGFGFWGG